MKKGILLLLLVSSFFADAQSLKEALYSGKLRNTPGTVIRKGDDLSTKMDTASKVTVDSAAMAKTTIVEVDAAAKKPAEQTETASTVTAENSTSATTSTDTSTAIETAPPVVESKPTVKDNNGIVKEYMTAVVNNLKTEVLSSKKIKKESYYVLVSYSIDTDGQMTVTDVFVSPENAFLQQQVKERLAVDTPKLVPTLSSNGTPRKVNKKYNFTLVKE